MTTAGNAPADMVERAYLWTGEFADPLLEAHFREAAWSETIERMRAIQLGVYMFACWSVIEYFLFGPTWTFFTLLCLRCLAPVVSRIPLQFFSGLERHRGFYAAVTFTQIYIFGVFMVFVAAGGMTAAEHALSAVLFTFAFYFGVPNRLKFNIAVSVAATAFFIAVVAAYPDATLRSLVLTALLLAMSNVVGAQAVRVSNRLRRNEFLTLMHQKELNEQLTREVAVRLEAQRAVRTTEENFQSLFRAAPLPIALIDPVSYRVIQANNAVLELFGINGEEASSIDARQFFADEEMRARLSEAATGTRQRDPIEARLHAPNGRIIWAHISAALVRFQGLPAFLIALQDVTARRREAEALREARDQATAASRSKSEFLANMSHELRTPLNAIIGFSEALERELFGPVGSPRYREYAEDIHDSGVHLLNLINDILDLSKIEAGHFKLHEDEADLDAVVASACRIVRHRAQQAAITIETALPMPPVGLLADERALKQILINLISNAVKFSEDRSTVRVEALVRAEGLRIAVIDKGIGIAADDIPKALAPFTQIDGTLSRAHEGTGLGLPLAKHLTELHGGELTIESEPGVGTTVYVDLPVSRLTPRARDLQVV
jgi:PAS domain S-box-containing protein